MPKAPDGTVVDESSSDEGVGAAVGGAEREAEEHGGKNQTQPVVLVPVHARNAVPVPQVP